MPENRNFRIFTVFTLLFLLMVLRIFYFQIFESENLSKSASSQRTRSYCIDKPRGDILDRNLIPLTDRSKKYTIVLKPIYLRDKLQDLEQICSIIGIDYQKTKRDVEIQRDPLLFDVDEEKKNAVMSLNVDGISVINSVKRYDENSVARHVTGYLNRIDQIGETGIEKMYNDVLEYDRENNVGVVIDARQNLVYGMGYRIITHDGNDKKLNVKLTLDYHIQRIVEDVMQSNNINGAVVVLDVCTGDIAAIASKPDFDHAAINQYLSSPDNELFNRATASYNLGSVFKIIDAALMLETGQDIDSDFFCPGYIKVGSIEFKCASYESGGHGLVDFKSAFAHSCNPFFIDMGLKMGYKNLIEAARRFGLGSYTGIREQGVSESRGNLPDENRYHSGGDIANISIGQGEIMATPLQVANLIATVANGGIMNRVNIADSIVDDNGSKVRELRVSEGHRVISKSIADTVKRLMEEVTDTGTGTRANLEQYGGAAGKTGSAETGRDGVVHAWFAGYFPRLDPKYAVTVFVENGQYGGKVAAPVFAEIAQEVMKKGL